ncbi:MAG: hypothetical protein ACPIOQ_34670, partial [Promethearchaeia archaeon]
SVSALAYMYYWPGDGSITVREGHKNVAHKHNNCQRMEDILAHGRRIHKASAVLVGEQHLRFVYSRVRCCVLHLCVCVCACVRACVRACGRAGVRAGGRAGVRAGVCPLYLRGHDTGNAINTRRCVAALLQHSHQSMCILHVRQ